VGFRAETVWFPLSVGFWSDLGEVWVEEIKAELTFAQENAQLLP
jgi:hypothetical protein